MCLLLLRPGTCCLLPRLTNHSRRGPFPSRSPPGRQAHASRRKCFFPQWHDRVDADCPLRPGPHFPLHHPPNGNGSTGDARPLPPFPRAPPTERQWQVQARQRLPETGGHRLHRGRRSQARDAESGAQLPSTTSALDMFSFLPQEAAKVRRTRRKRPRSAANRHHEQR